MAFTRHPGKFDMGHFDQSKFDISEILLIDDGIVGTDVQPMKDVTKPITDSVVIGSSKATNVSRAFADGINASDANVNRPTKIVSEGITLSESGTLTHKMAVGGNVWRSVVIAVYDLFIGRPWQWATGDTITSTWTRAASTVTGWANAASRSTIWTKAASTVTNWFS